MVEGRDYKELIDLLRIIELKLRGTDQYYCAMDLEAKVGLGDEIKRMIRKYGSRVHKKIRRKR